MEYHKNVYTPPNSTVFEFITITETVPFMKTKILTPKTVSTETKQHETETEQAFGTY